MSAARAHIYLRVSTEEQAAEGHSIGAQERACKLYAELQGVQETVLYTDDGYSGTKADRPGFVQLLRAVRTGDLVLVHKLDRFARNTALLLDTLSGFEQQGVRFVSVVEQIDFSTPIGKVMLTLLAAFAQYYVDNLRQETSKGHREKARKGLWVGPAPIGYRKLDRGHLEPSEDAPIVAEVFRLYVEEGQSYSTIAAELERRAVRPVAWAGERRQGVWGRENVRTILRNPAYIGQVSSGGSAYEGVHQPLVSAATWEAAAARRERRTGKPRPEAERVVPARFKDVLYCARCGARLWVKSSSRLGTLSYVCSQRGKCDAVQVVAAHVDAQIARLLRLIVVEDSAYQTAIERAEVDNGEVVNVVGKANYRELLAVVGRALHV